jgi:thymidylate synthase ThyX
VHLACEQASNLLTKVLERSRLMAYLEQSTRYVAYDSRLASGHYRYFRDPEILESSLGARYVGDMDRMFDTYGELLPTVQGWLTRRHPKASTDSDLAYRQSIRAKAFDALRGLLPAGSLSNVGIYGTGQSYELLLLHMRAHPLPEARHYAELMLEELRKAIPSFLKRVDRPDRGGEWSAYLAANRAAMDDLSERLFPAGQASGGGLPPMVTLADFDPDGENKIIAAMLYPHTDLAESELAERVARMSADERRQVVRAYVGDRINRRHRPGRALERTSYRFDVVSDYGAFRDLQRHRMLTIEWQRLDTSLGYEVPDVAIEAGVGPAFEESMVRSAAIYDALAPRFPEQAPYAVALAFRVRYVMQMTARESMHVLELRSGSQGHPAYRAVVQEMHRLIAEQAGHHAVAEMMSFVDHDDHASNGLGRLEAARRTEARRVAGGDRHPTRPAR